MSESRIEYRISKNKNRFLIEKNFEPVQLSVNNMQMMAKHYYEKYGIIIHFNGHYLKGKLSQKKSLSEIKKIQKNIKFGQFEAYVYTNGCIGDQKSHFEVIIIGKDEIIKPIQWKVDEIRELNSDNFCTVQLKDLCTENETTSHFPQADSKSCGSLGIAFVKELLKNNCFQLNQFTLRFPYYKNNQLKHFFFPSPQILRYSQSNAYIDVLIAILLSDEEKIIFKGKETLSLKGFLSQSIKMGLEENQRILDSLNDFRKNWMSEYQWTIQKREIMQAPLSSEEEESESIKRNLFDFIYYKFNKNNQQFEMAYFSFPAPYMTLKGKETSHLTELYFLAMLNDEAETNLFYKGKNINVKTLKGLLIQTIEIATQNNQPKIVENAKDLLDKLPSFRNSWIKEYKDLQNPNREPIVRNRYLTYTNHRMHKLSINQKINEIPDFYENNESKINNSEIWPNFFWYRGK